MSSARKYDIVIFGATGFTGKLAAAYVAKQYGDKVRWAIAGRSLEKLEAIKEQCGGIPDTLVADSNNEAELAKMCNQTKVVVTFAGPFSRYGPKLVAQCVEAGCDYCDITGEMKYVREMTAKHDDAARAKGSRIVCLCGHDSLPWDITTFMLAKKLKEQGSTELASVNFWDDILSKPSGGTLETAVGIMSGADGKVEAPEVTALGYDPLLKMADGSKSQSKVDVQNVTTPELACPSKGHSAVRTFFVMSGVNANAVKRSNALNGYGPKMVYREGQAHASLGAALKATATLGAFGLAMAIPPTRNFLKNNVLPQPGEGPSEEFMAKGYLNLTGVATGNDGQVVKATMRFPVDPGYKDTARMAIESGLALALDSDDLESKAGGVFTPGCCQKEVVLKRLLQTGTTFEIEQIEK